MRVFIKSIKTRLSRQRWFYRLVNRSLAYYYAAFEWVSRWLSWQMRDAVLVGVDAVSAPEPAGPFRHEVAVALRFKNEASYLAEWIEFHHASGIEHFYLYNNNSTDNFQEVLAPYVRSGLVTLHDWPQVPASPRADLHCISHYRQEARWIAFLDADEFLFPVDGRSLKDVLREYENFPALAVNWIYFGSNGLLERPAAGVLEGFTRRAASANRHVKSIVNPRKVIKYGNSHHWFYTGAAPAVNTRKLPVFGSFAEPAVADVLRVNHYYSKSREEFMAKAAMKSWVDKEGARFPSRTLDAWNQQASANNDVEDTSAVDFLAARKDGTMNRPAASRPPGHALQPPDVREGDLASAPDRPAATRAPNLERRALSGSVANIASIFAILLQNLALVPILLHRWSTDTYGIWITLLAVQSLLFTINYGQEAYVGYEAARLLHEDRPALPALIGAGIWLGIALYVGEVALILGLGFTHFTSLFGAGPVLADGWKPLAVVVGCWVGFGSTANILIRMMYALGFYSRFTMYSVIFRVLTALAVAVAASLGMALWGAVLAYSLTTMLTQAALMVMAWRIMRKHEVPIGRPRLPLMFGILTKSVLVSGTSLLDAFSNNGLLTIISSVLTPALVPSFSTLRTITNTANQGVAVIMHPLDPDMIRYQANREWAKLYEIFGVCWTVAGSSINFGLCVLPVFIEPVYRTWTRGKLPFNFPLFSLLALSVAFRTLGHPALAFLQATNALKAQARISLIRAVVVISLSFALIYPFGLFGVGVALAISELIGAATLPAWYALGTFAATDAPFPFRRMAAAVASVGIVASAFALCCAFPGLKNAICVLCAAGIATLAAVQWSMLHDETRLRITSLLKIPGWPRRTDPVVAEAVIKPRVGSLR